MKIGILGGTFDPVHRGHTYLATAVLKTFDLSRVDLMVSRVPPHKETRGITSACHRQAMLELDLSQESSLFPSRWEMDQPGPSYTIDTLDHFKSTHPENKYCFLAGSDALQELHLWKDYDRLLAEHCLIFVQRPGFTVELTQLNLSSSLLERVQTVNEGDRPQIRFGASFLIQLNAPTISASAIRKMTASGKSPTPDILSPKVLRYVEEHHLYAT
ncbi:MAG: nicotinate (nicotinamide) nucleotide adenylyltransferase [Acidobacteriota bacterium]